MEQEIASQPTLLRKNCAQYYSKARDGLSSLPPQMILLVARGSSDNAALFARYLIEIHLGIPVSMAAPSVVTKYKAHLKYPPCLAIGVSQSGSAPDVAEVLDSMQQSGHQTIAITNREGSLVGQSANAEIFLNASEERSVAATKTFTSTMLALYQVVRALGAKLEDPAEFLPDESWLQNQRSAAELVAGELNRVSPIFCLSRGYGFSVAQETALKLMECALIPAKSYSTADFEHGPKALAGPGSAAILYGEGGDNLRSQGCKIIQPPRFNGPEEISPIANVMYGQWLALLTARTRNLDPDSPSFIQKVTETL